MVTDLLGISGFITKPFSFEQLLEKVEDALALNDGDVFHFLEEIPVKKHHCIQLAVKALLGAIKSYRDANGPDDQVVKAGIPTGHGRRGDVHDDSAACCGAPKGQGSCKTAGTCCGKTITGQE